jgi:mono/diheme cytochrome c family protein
MLFPKVVLFCCFFLFLCHSAFAQDPENSPWQAPDEAARQLNPIPPYSDSIRRGQEIFSQMCSYCHGEQAQGQTAEAAGTDTPPPNLVRRLRRFSPGDMHWKIQNGRGEMPPFLADLNDQEIWDIINYIASCP